MHYYLIILSVKITTCTLFSVHRLVTLVLAIILFATSYTFAQAPAISYTTPHIYALNLPISTLAPNNTGGPVPANIYGQVSTLAGGRAPVTYDSFGTDAGFNSPSGVGTATDGTIYVSDYGSGAIRKISPLGNVITVNNVGTPASLTLDNHNNIYISDFQSNNIFKIASNGVKTVFAGNSSAGYSNGTGTAASFNSPGGVAADASGNIYVADQQNNMIRKITPAGVVTTIAGSGNPGAENNIGTAATFNNPDGVAIDKLGNIFVSDTKNNLIRKITPTGNVSTFAGSGTAGNTNSAGTAAAFNYPTSLAFDASGNLFIADYKNSLIRKITPVGVVTTVAGNSSQGAVNGIGIAASFNYPIGLAFDADDNLFVTDFGNNLVRKITLTGYTIDKPLPAGLSFDPKTGIITGTPTVLSPLTDYTVTAYNGAGSSSTIVKIQVVADITKQPSIITFPPPMVIHIDPDNVLHPGATSTNTETPITYTSSNPAVAYVGEDGQIHVIAPGVTFITAYQAGNDNYAAATPVGRTFTITQDQVIFFPEIDAKTTCNADFALGAQSSNSLIPLTYVSSNMAVATVSAVGDVHIVGIGTTIITVSQSGDNLYNPAVPVSHTLTVKELVTPSVTISPDFYASCDGLTLTYTATAVNAGPHPIYQWMLNGQNSGDNRATYTSSTLKTGDVITCIVTNNDGCAPITSPVSNPASMEANPYVTLGLTIASSASGPIEIGTPITFRATPSANVNGRTVFQWQVNGQNVGVNSSTFTTKTLVDGDVVTCIMNSDGGCIVNPSVVSNVIIVNIVIPPQIVIPNTFTPNGDGHNDTWEIDALLPFSNCTINVYNRYGAIVYRSVGYQQFWDGTTGGKPLPSGTYYYLIDPKNGKLPLSGPVTIIR